MLELWEEKERSNIKSDLHISSKQPLGLGRTQGWGLMTTLVLQAFSQSQRRFGSLNLCYMCYAEPITLILEVRIEEA